MALRVIEIEDEESHDFEALSYVWGSDSKEGVVYIKGAPIRITKSVSSFLHRLYQPTESRRLWLDGICINQDDIEEKGRQISLLRKTERGRRFPAHRLDSGHLWQKFQKPHLIDLLYYFQISSATIDKDRYFALLSIADDMVKDGKAQLELTYRTPTDKIIIMVGRFLIQNAYGEEMLGSAGIWQQRDLKSPRGTRTGAARRAY
ncbi:Heterokaryon incompatibility protein 6, OR allele [Madurella mycetomatis]|uniref:Heterokaryon incompatibility protein 6, OR allele n=1 Tax=Madurella mycetomatis TaxID=100816 RepID=A0A175WGT2_9PEZI|nr:Heterokaryon incompatibility protein 6, OR allele [Madurella mycetomatis]KXX83047.1 Heterokaryon incompatibility protein 6, OR allele [Madurella mycetomatis]